MRTTRLITAAGVALAIGTGLPLHMTHSHELEVKRTQAAHESAPSETVTVTAVKPIPSLPEKRLVSVIVDYPPGASSKPHRHARSAFIYAYVLSGEIRSAVDSEPPRVYRAGQSWFENPGSHHRVSANASDSEPARLLAVFIIDVADEQLTLPDEY